MKVLVIGVGNLLLGDEGVGVHAIRELERATLPPNTRRVTILSRYPDPVGADWTGPYDKVGRARTWHEVRAMLEATYGRRDFVIFYTHERNFGCRLREYLYKGLRVVTLENELLRVSILADKGTDIFEFLYTPLDVGYSM